MIWLPPARLALAVVLSVGVATSLSTGPVAQAADAVMCDGRTATIVGTSGDDYLYGTPGPDVIAPLGGHDEVYGVGGNDVICSGSGQDRLYGGAGNDRLVADPAVRAGRALVRGVVVRRAHAAPPAGPAPPDGRVDDGAEPEPKPSEERRPTPVGRESGSSPT